MDIPYISQDEVKSPLLDMNSQDIFIVSEEGAPLYVNQTAFERRNMTRDELMGMRVWQWNRFIRPSSWQKRWTWLLKTKSANFTTEHRLDDGTPMPVNISVQLVNYAGQLGALCYVQDISEFQNATADADRADKLMDLVLSGSNLSICTWDPYSDIVQLDKSWLTLFGEMPDNLRISFSQWEAMVAPNFRSEWRDRLTAHLLGQDDEFNLIHPMTDAQGGILLIHSRGKIVDVDKDGYPIAVAVVHERLRHTGNDPEIN